jgi:hypothetical protein
MPREPPVTRAMRPFRENRSFVKVLLDLVLSIPALLAGSALGIFTFRSANETTFRRIILIVLLLSGVLLVV